MTMKRFENWPQRMTTYIGEVSEKPFAYGAFDCCLFAAGCVEAMTGVDIAADYRGGYSDAASALNVLDDLTGGGGLAAMMEKFAAAYGWEAIESNRYAQRGDIALLRAAVCDAPEFGGALGICLGPLTAFLRDGRLAAISTIELPEAEPNVVRLWRIPLGRD